MKLFYALLIFLLNISQYQFQSLPCRTNCSDDQCWREALTYRSSELVEQLFSFGSLTIHVDTFLREHPDELNDTMKFLDEPLQNYLVNESKDSHLPVDLFSATKQRLINACRNLTLTAIKDISELPSLACSTRTCAGDILNYTVLFIVATTLATLILIICVVQLVKTRRQSSSLVTVQRPGPLLNHLSTTHDTSLNSQY
ncbi:unnamed protein product [Adineta ricciae]|uniref:Uncharacterized protein n=1 Tax=Adineta ricciae TaxID=249248 RepID=A0A813QLZ6_ADIRI|nr:unnamed protein product [Adineta ricciae]